MQLPVWIPVGYACGIALWFRLQGFWTVIAAISACLALALAAMAAAQRGEGSSLLRRCLVVAPLLVALGIATIAAHAAFGPAGTLERPRYGTVNARIVEREELPARDIVRFVMELPEDDLLPRRVRVNLDMADDVPALRADALIQARVRLMPPAQSALPGAYSFAQRAWFDGIGASGTMLDAPRVLRESRSQNAFADLRARLSAHIRAQLDGSAGAIAATLATGDRGAIPDDDAEAMRRSGLAHLLSISGLHVSAVIAAAWLLTMKVLALSPGLAMRFRLPFAAAAMAALAGLGYTLLAGAEVPTIRACVAALLVLLALVLGRDPISLRLVATGAMIVLVIWPEALAGPSFQLSFAAVTAIIALHDHPRMRAWASPEERGWLRRAGRFLFSLFLTGLLIEFTLMPIALYHFHKAGLYGALANLIAIPLTTLVIMPLEAVALVLDIAGLGAPFWWLAGVALDWLLALARFTASAPGSVTYMPDMGRTIFALFVFGGLWLFLWRSRARYWGLLPILIATAGVAALKSPDLLVTSDGRHVAIRAGNDNLVLLREGQPDGYARQMLLETAGFSGEPQLIDAWRGARCNPEFCSVLISAPDRTYRILLSRNREYVPQRALHAACRRSDIVISDRWLPGACRPKWLRIDRAFLARHGGLAIYLDQRRVDTVADEDAGKPWFPPARE
ncbi:MAG: ComEC/Rec2 family competence protein [Blastomonas sp.]